MVSPCVILAICAFIANTLALPQGEGGLGPNLNPFNQGDNTGFRLDTWEQLNCPGKPTAHAELNMNISTPLSKFFVAYKVSQTMGPTEQLDFSGADPSITGGTIDYCAKFVEQTNPMKSPEYGSTLLQKDRCYSLTGGVSAHCANLHTLELRHGDR